MEAPLPFNAFDAIDQASLSSLACPAAGTCVALGSYDSSTGQCGDVGVEEILIVPTGLEPQLLESAPR
jgi:hypothetical protein